MKNVRFEEMVRIRMPEVAGTDVLAGARAGRVALGRLLDLVGEGPKEAELIYVDFEGVEVATASYLRESVIEFRDAIRRRWPPWYPVVANANQSILDELGVLVALRRDVLACCVLNNDGRPSAPILVGRLEPKQRIAFDLVQRLGEADAAELMEKSGNSEDVGQTAWNNRLAALSRLGVLMEISKGRAKRYRPLPLEV